MLLLWRPEKSVRSVTWIWKVALSDEPQRNEPFTANPRTFSRPIVEPGLRLSSLSDQSKCYAIERKTKDSRQIGTVTFV
ncbi:hypothetical protein SLS60_003790 [Paraconiothyrium brasiliense]|uniref:Uncharacterized protein n=1 Tax=Paraconiothyrium brasiliense TaxID=300254 RepID=A0ABR3RR50_9PLEO